MINKRSYLDFYITPLGAAVLMIIAFIAGIAPQAVSTLDTDEKNTIIINDRTSGNPSKTKLLSQKSSTNAPNPN